MTPLVFSFFFSSDVEDEKSIASLSFLPFSPITSFPTSSTSNALNLFSSSTCTIVPYLTDTLICLSLPLVKLSSSSLNLCTDTAPQLENTNGPTTDSFSSVCFIFFFSSLILLLLLLRFSFTTNRKLLSLSLLCRLFKRKRCSRKEKGQKRNSRDRKLSSV